MTGSLALQRLETDVIDFNQNGALDTFENPPEDLIRNGQSLGRGLDRLVDEGRISVIDAPPAPIADVIEVESFDFKALLARIKNAVNKAGAKRVILDETCGGLLRGSINLVSDAAGTGKTLKVLLS